MSYSSGYAASDLVGATGAPKVGGGKETTCQECHGTGGPNTIQTSTSIEIIDTTSGKAITTYIPNNIYKARVTVNKIAGTPKAYGFQMVSLKDNGFVDVKGWSNPGTNVNIINLTSGQKRSYVEQPKLSTSNVFETNWKAPTSQSGKVTFYASGNGVNGNGSTGGDGASVGTLSLSEGTVATTEISDNFNLIVYPTIVLDYLDLSFESNEIKKCRLNIINTEGRIVFQKYIDNNGSIYRETIDTHDLLKGVYFIHVTNGKIIKTQKFIKE